MMRIILALLVFSVPSYAHDWYDFDCCDERDCYPLPDAAFLEERDNGAYFARWVSPIDGKLIEGIVSAQNVRDTHNHQIHGCQTSYGTPRCLYIHRGA